MVSAVDYSALATTAARSIEARWNRKPVFGIILGTGAGQLADEIDTEVRLRYQEIPHFPTSTAIGHQGQLVLGQLAGQPVVAMQGRFHLYEGYPVDLATLPIRVMRQLGVEFLYVSNASGGINPEYRSGEIMLIDSHLDLMFQSSPGLAGPVCHQRPLRRSDAYDDVLINDAQACARRIGIPIHRGVYAGMLGPNYETRAEYRFLRQIGADVAGMSTVPEVCVAARLGVRILGLSVVSNVANPDQLEATSGQEVIDAASQAAPHLAAIVIDSIQRQRYP